MSKERLVMDPAEVSEGREQLDITALVAAAGLDSGDTVAEVYKSQGDFGEDDLDTRYPNVPMSAPLILRDLGGTALATWRSLLQGKVSLWQRAGGILGRYTQQGTAYATIGKTTDLVLGGDVLQALGIVDANALINMERKPGWWQPEVELSLHEEKTNPELIFTETTIKGDMPAPCRVEVVEKQGVDRKGLVWGYRKRYYSSTSTAKPAYAATELGLLGEAAKGAVTGAVSGTAVSNTALPAVWTPVLNTNLGGSTYLTHQGTYRVKARLRSPQGTAVSARLAWDVGDLVYPTENPSFTFPASSAWFWADLGEVRLDAPPVGAHRWQGQIQAKGTTGEEDINIDRVWIVNSDESMGVISSPAALAPGLVSYSARDEFNQTAGTLNGKTIPTGGTWTTSGATTDFSVSGSGLVTRSSKLDALQRTAQPPGTTAKASAIEFEWSALPTESSNTLSMRLGFKSGAEALAKYSTLIGVSSILELGGRTVAYPWKAGTRYSVCLLIRDAQYAAVWVKPGGGEVTGAPELVAPISGTGGTAIFTDFYDGNQSITRTFDNFRAWVPVYDSAVFASQKAQLTTDGMFRQDVGGTAYGPVSRVVGDLPRLPVGGTVEVFIGSSRGDFDRLADSGIDDTAARVFYKPTWLTFPGT